MKSKNNIGKKNTAIEKDEEREKEEIEKEEGGNGVKVKERRKE